MEDFSFDEIELGHHDTQGCRQNIGCGLMGCGTLGLGIAAVFAVAHLAPEYTLPAAILVTGALALAAGVKVVSNHFSR